MISHYLAFIAESIGGEMYEYDDGYVIEVLTGGPQKVVFTYSSDGTLNNTEIK